MKLHVIVTAYERPVSLRILVDSFLVQTNPNWIMYVVHDGPSSPLIKKVMQEYINDSRISFEETPVRQQKYGHPIRKMMLRKIVGEVDDYILITNDDNYYIPVFVEYFLKKANKMTGMIFCNTLHSYMGYDVLFTKVKQNYIDMGSFIVSLPIARRVGFRHEDLTADGKYAVECADYCKKRRIGIFYINKALFVHN